MITYPLATEKVPVFAFEVSVIETGHRGIAKLLQDIEGVSNVSVRRPFSSSDSLVKFTYQNTGFIVCEPFGDNSRYWIGPAVQTDSDDVDISRIEKKFCCAPSNKIRAFIAKVLG